MRKLLAPDFKPSMIRRMAATVQDVVAKHLAPLQSAEEIDVVKLVQEVPLTTITRILGVDASSPGARIILKSAPDFFRGSNPLATDERRDDAERAAIAMNEVLSEVVEERRARPQEDLISQTLRLAGEVGTFSTEEITNLLVILVAAGTDTTRLASSLAVKTLIACPEARETLRADRSLLDGAVLEFLRYESPTKMLVRTTSNDVPCGSTTIPAGSLVLLSPFAAGLDPKVFPEPDVFDPRRETRGVLAFGLGAHYCLGVHLAKQQVGSIVSFFLDHMPDTASMDVDAIQWDPFNLFLRELTSMPLQLR
jgi:cytochrome P450